jgi:hypothetical protein
MTLETPHHIEVQLVESLDELASVRDAWHKLLARALPGRDFFYRLEMLQALLPVHAAGRRSPFLLLAYEAGELVGALPLVLDRKPLSRMCVRVLNLWGDDGSALSVEGDIPLLGDAHRIMSAFRAALLGPLRPRFDVLVLGYLRGDAIALPALLATFPDAHFTPESLTAHHLELPADFALYRSTRNGSRLRELGRRRRKFESAHDVSLAGHFDAERRTT